MHVLITETFFFKGGKDNSKETEATSSWQRQKRCEAIRKHVFV